MVSFTKQFLLVFLICLAVGERTSAFQNLEKFKGLNFSPRIASGFPVDFTDVPFQVSIQYVFADDITGASTHLCSGVLVENGHVLTAANCLFYAADQPIPSSNLRVLTGTNDASKNSSVSQTIPLRFIAIHPDFSNVTLDNNLAILHLRQNFTIPGLKPIELTSIIPEVGKIGAIVGYGFYNQTDTDLILRNGTVKVADFERCKKWYSDTYNYTVTENMFCTDERSGVCQGDTGGPLIYINMLSGINWFGDACRAPLRDHPGLYTKIGPYIDWIKQQLGIPQKRK